MELSDAELIREMKRRASEVGEWDAVQGSFQGYRELGMTVKEASSAALYYWDC